MLATPIGSSAKALDENMPAAVAAVVCRNRLRLRFIAVALLTVPSQDFTDTNDPGARWNWVEPPSRSRFLFEHDLFGKPLHTFPDHALIHFPVAARLDRGGQPDQGRLVEVAAGQRHADPAHHDR